MKRPGRAPRLVTDLARWMDRKGLTQADFAQRCSRWGFQVPVKMVQRWASGTSTPRQHARVLIARATRGEVPEEAWAKREAGGG